MPIQQPSGQCNFFKEFKCLNSHAEGPKLVFKSLRKKKNTPWENPHHCRVSSILFAEHALHVAPVSNPGLKAVCLVQWAQFWPSVYKQTDARTRKKLVWQDNTRLTSPKVRAVATSKVWRDSGRASFSPRSQGENPGNTIKSRTLNW